MINRKFAEVCQVLQDGQQQNPQPAVPVAAKAPVSARLPARANVAKPKSTASLYARVRQVVRENKTEETKRLGIGDIAFENVPDDGSIMVGVEVTYAPFFDHNIIKSVRPIYQRPDGKRYDGPVCGNPTGVGVRVVATEGYAIGGAAIRAGMGIDGMQLTFMQIGANGLNPNKTYLSKWLGGYGGADAKTFVNDGRPIIGIAGMRSKNPSGPAFCLCLVTTKAGALDDADSPPAKQNWATNISRYPPIPPFRVDLEHGSFVVQYYSNWDNWGGLGEKWFLGDNSRWYYVLPNGNLYASYCGSIGPNDSLVGNVKTAGAVNPTPPPPAR